MKIKNAIITKNKNPFYPVEHYDYILTLTKRQYDKFRKEGLNVKTITNRATGKAKYFINVYPLKYVSEVDKYLIPDEKDYLNKPGIDIDFRIWSREIKPGQVVTRLTFNAQSITNVADKNKKFLDRITREINEKVNSGELSKEYIQEYIYKELGSK